MSKLSSLLGFAQRAGKLVSGEEQVEGRIRRGRVCFLIIAQDCSNNTRLKFINMAENYEVPYACLGSKDELGQIIGKPQRAVVGVCDRKFATTIRAHLNTSE